MRIQQTERRSLTSVVRAARVWHIAGTSGNGMAIVRSSGWEDAQAVSEILKSGVAGTNVPASVRGSPLVDIATLTTRESVLGKLAGVKQMPPNIPLLGATAGVTAHWTQEGRSLPVGRIPFGAPEYVQTKRVGALLVTTDDVIESSDPRVEEALGNDLVRAVVQAQDRVFLDPYGTGSESTPASITSAGFLHSSTGSTISDLTEDFKAAVRALTDSGSTLRYASVVVEAPLAIFLATLRTAGGELAFPGVSVNGGTIFGLPLIVAASDTELDSSARCNLHIIDGERVLLIDQGDGGISASKNTVIELDDDPSGDATTPVGASRHAVSMFQTNCTAIKLERYMTWRPRLPYAAATVLGISIA